MDSVLPTTHCLKANPQPYRLDRTLDQSSGSLDQDLARLGSQEDGHPKAEKSLSDQSTFGDAGSSASDVSGLDDTFDSNMEVVDLSSRKEGLLPSFKR